MLSKFLRKFFVSLGSFLIGLGIGMIVAGNFGLGERSYWLIVIFSLVLGGFLLALGIKKKEEEIEPEEEEIEPEE